MMIKIGAAMLAVGMLTGCATLTEDPMTPVALSFSDGTAGQCNLSNKRGGWPAIIPSVTNVRRSDDALRYDCTSHDGRKAFGSIPSEMGGKIIASAVFLDFGITDAITDKHRRYASSYVIPMVPAGPPGSTAARAPVTTNGYPPPAQQQGPYQMDPAKRCDACERIGKP